MTTKCSEIRCQDRSNDGICLSVLDYVNRETGEDMCPRNSDAIPRQEWDEQHPPVAQQAPELREYLLTIRVRFKALDDPAARHVAQVSLATHGLVGSDDFYTKGMIEKKLQRLSKSGPPEKVEM